MYTLSVNGVFVVGLGYVVGYSAVAVFSSFEPTQEVIQVLTMILFGAVTVTARIKAAYRSRKEEYRSQKLYERKEEILESYLEEQDRILDGLEINSIIEKSVHLTLARGELEDQNILAAISIEEITLDHMKDITTHLEMIRSEEKSEKAVIIGRDITDSAIEICDGQRFEFKRLNRSELEKMDEEIDYNFLKYIRDLFR